MRTHARTPRTSASLRCAMNASAYTATLAPATSRKARPLSLRHRARACGHGPRGQPWSQQASVAQKGGGV